eukprot:COSAG01_NODE_7093_length_3356_cov_148.126190_4_plen_40_part_01
MAARDAPHRASVSPHPPNAFWGAEKKDRSSHSRPEISVVV